MTYIPKHFSSFLSSFQKIRVNDLFTSFTWKIWGDHLFQAGYHLNISEGFFSEFCRAIVPSKKNFRGEILNLHVSNVSMAQSWQDTVLGLLHSSLACGKSHNCPNASELILKDMGKINRYQTTTKCEPFHMFFGMLCFVLIHINILWPRQKATILQMTFSNVFSWNKTFEFQIKRHLNILLWAQLICKYWFS